MKKVGPITKTLRLPLLTVGCAIALAGCPAEKEAEEAAAEVEAETEQAAQAATKPAAMEKEEPMKKELTKIGPVPLKAKEGTGMTGEVMLEEVEGGGVRVKVSVKNAPPGKHGTHIHEKGDCSAPDFKSAGGHFAPRGHKHGLTTEDPKHLGDLGNLEVDEDGSGELTYVVEKATLDEGGEMSFRGKGLIFHDKPDDGGQPTGNAGPRLGCAELK